MKRQRARTGIKWAAIASAVTLAATLTAWNVLDREPSPAAREAGPVVAPLQASTDGLALPKKVGSLRFAVMGDVGRGDRNQYDTANEMARWHERFDFSFVLMLGDNIYAEQGTTEAYQARFERPYKALLDRGVMFYATLGNHDPPGQPDYVPFNMNGNRYYNFLSRPGRRCRWRAAASSSSRSIPSRSTRRRSIWLRRSPRRVRRGLADLLLPPPALHVRPLPVRGGVAPAPARADPGPVRRRRRAQRARALLRADRAAARHPVLHFGRGRRAAPRRHPRYGVHGGRLRSGHALPPDRDRRRDDLYFQAISRTGQTIDSGRSSSASRARRRRQCYGSEGHGGRFAISCTFFMKTLHPRGEIGRGRGARVRIGEARAFEETPDVRFRQHPTAAQRAARAHPRRSPSAGTGCLHRACAPCSRRIRSRPSRSARPPTCRIALWSVRTWRRGPEASGADARTVCSASLVVLRAPTHMSR